MPGASVSTRPAACDFIGTSKRSLAFLWPSNFNLNKVNKGKLKASDINGFGRDALLIFLSAPKQGFAELCLNWKTCFVDAFVAGGCWIFGWRMLSCLKSSHKPLSSMVTGKTPIEENSTLTRYCRCRIQVCSVIRSLEILWWGLTVSRYPQLQLKMRGWFKILF